MKCKHIKADGQQCRANALTGSDFCYFHNPETKEKMLESSSKGGSKRIYPDLDEFHFTGKPEDLIKLLQDSINDLRTNRINERKATAINALTGGLMKAIELINLEERITDLENKLNERC